MLLCCRTYYHHHHRHIIHWVHQHHLECPNLLSLCIVYALMQLWSVRVRGAFSLVILGEAGLFYCELNFVPISSFTTSTSLQVVFRNLYICMVHLPIKYVHFSKLFVCDVSGNVPTEHTFEIYLCFFIVTTRIILIDSGYHHSVVFHWSTLSK